MATDPTRPIDPDSEPTAVIARRGNTRCRAGHDQPNNPTWHETLGLVPALTSVIIGALLVAILYALEWWLLPALISWTTALLLAALVVSGIVQLLLGHRSWCLVWRTLRWWLGSIGTLIDPIEMG